ncbi:polysaccharide deacetylase family protein [Sporosarcina cyprini]|uniref:polysaccharide deacetylase family protein n=1 Tax=Sporosarcina cyprini TaxID=2910523 RepID=UPI001EDD005B|nr:polysaccharide deacetylase [Sporosarcina cyprini]MCG3088479.1 polysaccharide deacetylase family protein [Sporosarcina cyprini]
MKQKFSIALILLFICGLLLGTGTNAAAASQGTPSSQRLIALHDRILPIEDVRVVDGDTKVPLKDLAKYLYLPVEVVEGVTVIQKRGMEFRFDPVTGITTKDGKELSWSPIREIDGTTYMSVKYIAKEIGFELDFFPQEKTIRIFREDYKHSGYDAFQQAIQHYRLEQQEAAKPVPKPTPKPVKPTSPETAKKKPNVYLTFDDGPNQFTTVNLKTLKEQEVQATFFFLGKHMKKNPSIVKAAAKDGHYIGSHSMTHDKELVYKSTDSFMNEMKESTQLIQKITGKSTKLIRVPYGSKPHVTPDMQKQLAAGGYKMWDWDVDSNDWRFTEEETEKIIANVKEGVAKAEKAGDRDIVILMHDRSQTTKALPAIIEWLKEEGYTFKKYENDHHVVKNFLHDKAL